MTSITDFLTLSEAAAFLADRGIVGPQGKPFAQATLRKACNSGYIEGAMLRGRAWLVTKDAALAWAGAEGLHKTGKPAKGAK